MADEYSEIFNIPCHVIGKGVTQDDINNIPAYIPKNNGKLKIIYTGNVSADRYSVLYALGTEISNRFSGKAYMEIYTQTQLSDEMKEGFDSIKDSVFLMGAVSSQEVKGIQRESDILLHIEGFSKKSLFEVRMSFSTKIIDYMLTGVPILAIGPNTVNSISVLEENSLATVITDINCIADALQSLFDDFGHADKYRENIIAYLQEYRNIDVIQSDIHHRLVSLSDKC
jgi:glycosyltransferase involved in cell wall biosynthesis